MAKRKTPKKQPPKKPDLIRYFESVGAELHAVKDRIRNLVKHWPTDGSHKEAALRTVLRRHLPSTLELARGFVVTPDAASSEIDILVIERSCPTLFRDENLVIVSPKSVRAIIEVKTELKGVQSIQEAAVKLSANKQVCLSQPGYSTWAGLFVYEGRVRASNSILMALNKGWKKTKCAIDGVAFGSDLLVRHFDRGTLMELPEEGHVWYALETPKMAAPYFVGAMMEDLDLVEPWERRLWLPATKDNRRRAYLPFGATKVRHLSGPIRNKSDEK